MVGAQRSAVLKASSFEVTRTLLAAYPAVVARKRDRWTAAEVAEGNLASTALHFGLSPCWCPNFVAGWAGAHLADLQIKNVS